MGIVDLLFPKSCLNCGDGGFYVCAKCINSATKLKQICVGCGKPSIDGVTHTRCLKPQRMNGLIHLWPYGGVVRKAILGLKYKYATEIAKELSVHIEKEIKSERVSLPRKATLIPIPLHKQREKWRGFNQVGEIGNLVSERLDWEFMPDLLIRKELRTPQTELKGEERRSNIKGAFSLNTKYNIPDTKYDIILFDDVYTTGSTLKEAGKVLKRSGAKNVWGLTIAR